MVCLEDFMRSGFRVLACSAVVAAATIIMHADAQLPSQLGEIELRLGRFLFEQGQYPEALEAYRNAVASEDAGTSRRARSGVILAALRVAEFGLARREAEELVKMAPRDAETLALYGDSLWAAGQFDRAEEKYRDALSLQPDLARGHHGIARSLLARTKLDEALNEAQAALRLAPRDLEIHHTVGAIYERMHKYEEAAAAYGNYVNLLPNKDRSEKAEWARAEIRFLRSFGQRLPFDMDPGADTETYTIDFRLVKEKVVVRAKVNGSSAQDFVVDTGAESTVLTRPTIERLGVAPITYTLSAGVGDIGLRGLQLARIDSIEIGNLKARNIPVLVKSPPLRDIPQRETESLSPLALGFSMTIDYKTHKLTFGKHLPEEPADFELPLRLYRLATVSGIVSGGHPANFVVDTGGEVISISHATADAIPKSDLRRIPLKVWGTSGWEKDAFLLPGIDLSFDQIQYKNFSVVVLNLDAPSVLLGFQLGGIVGTQFLKNYRVGIDLERSMLRLKRQT
jgi:tetratricopeptide (TPR) repeat protein/predicted aspartyl protease